MISNYLKIAWRNLIKNKAHSIINILGLSAGMAVAILIGLWIYSELTFNRDYPNHDRLGIVMQNQTFNGETNSQTAVPYVMGDQLRKEYSGDFKHVAMATWLINHVLAFGENKINQKGNFIEPEITDMLSLKMLKGTRKALYDKQSIILSASTAKALFGDADPMNKRIKLDGKSDVTVSGVYEDLPSNSDFRDLTFIAPWKLYIDNSQWSEKYTNPWRNNSFITYVQISDNADFNTLSNKIKDVKLRQVHTAEAAFKPRVFLHPMSRWHLYSEFNNGVQTGGRIEFVWMFGIIGSFVLLLACINFMNLSTARSEKRAKEVGIRKAVGSLRTQLVKQFFAESIVVAVIAFAVSLILVELILPYFNQVAGKNLQILWCQPMFWITSLCFAVFTGFIAGTYPALYLSSFKPVKVLKGTFKAGKMASVPRKVLVVLQFTISVILIIGTIVVFKQVQFAREKKTGYDKDGLLTINAMTDDIHKHFDAFESELKGSGAVSSIAESSSPVTAIQEVDNGFSWEGKAPEVQGDFSVVRTSFGFGKTISWKIKEGRDFSKDFPTDSIGIILNESAVKFMNLKDPVGKTINWDGQAFHVIGVVNDIIMYSPYLPVFRGVFIMDHQALPNITVRLNNRMSTNDAINKIETIFKKYNPSQPFSYQFTDEEYQHKFENEQRVGKLANFFTILAIFISCLGLYGMASFMAEQRTKELGVRKVLGASVLHLWSLMSAEFVMLITISLLIAGPTAWYLMHKWLEKYEYRTTISWWIFALTAMVAIVLTLATVSYQSIKAALTNPIKSLKTE